MLLQDNIIYTRQRNLTYVSKSLLGPFYSHSFHSNVKNITILNKVTKIYFSKRYYPRGNDKIFGCTSKIVGQGLKLKNTVTPAIQANSTVVKPSANSTFTAHSYSPSAGITENTTNVVNTSWNNFKQLAKQSTNTTLLTTTKGIKTTVSHTATPTEPKREMSTLIGIRIKSKYCKNNYAPDKTGLHVAGGKEICDEPGCETVLCYSLCGNLVEIEITGNATHKPVNNDSEVLDATKDMSGNNKKQYYQKANPRRKISAEDAKDLTEDDLEEIKNATKFFNSSSDIANKIK